MYKPDIFYHHSIFSEVKQEPISHPYEYNRMNSPTDSAFIDSPKKSRILNLDDGDDDATENKKGKQQKCNICDKVLSSASSYYVHLKKHSNHKPYHCSQCDASFCRKPYLEVHMRTHTGEKPFECNICQKRFTQKSSLNTHKRSHTGQRPFSCDVCYKSFSVKSYLEAHKWSHAASNGIPCSVCPLRFNNKSQYMHHIQIHNSKKFECEDCNKNFAKESFLIRHRTRVHTKVSHSDK